MSLIESSIPNPGASEGASIPSFGKAIPGFVR